MKKFKFLTGCVSTLVVLVSWFSANAQTASNHVVTINTQYMLPTDSAGRAERDALLKEYFDKVVLKNQYILHESTLIHYYTDDSREMVTIDEYATWADVEKANDRFDELERQAWPDANKRKAMFDKMSKYFSSHKDAIYHQMPLMVK